MTNQNQTSPRPLAPAPGPAVWAQKNPAPPQGQGREAVKVIKKLHDNQNQYQHSTPGARPLGTGTLAHLIDLEAHLEAMTLELEALTGEYSPVSVSANETLRRLHVYLEEARHDHPQAA